jgi:hypothetical protein
MKLITWNCKGAFHRKHASVATLQPDVLVVPEAAQMRDIDNVIGCRPVRSLQWIGSNPKKGLAVVSYGDYSIEVHEAYDPSHRWIVPLRVEGPEPFTLFAVWSVPHLVTKTYVQCLFDALDTYKELLASPRIIWAGDFNNNVVLGPRKSPRHFSFVIAAMEQLGFQSLYHLHRGANHGEEKEPTFFLHHNPDRPFHLDYIFASADLCGAEVEVTVGTPADWLKSSDHMPVSCTFHATRVPRPSRPPSGGR